MKNTFKNVITAIIFGIAIICTSCTKEDYYPNDYPNDGPTTIVISPKADTIITETYVNRVRETIPLEQSMLVDTTIDFDVCWSFKAIDNPKLKVEYNHHVTETARYRVEYDKYYHHYIVKEKLNVIQQTYVNDTTSKSILHNMKYVYNDLVERTDFDNIFDINQQNCSQIDALFYPFYGKMKVELYYYEGYQQYRHTDICYNEEIANSLRQKIEQGQHKIEQENL